jgi:cell division transport system permease protein
MIMHAILRGIKFALQSFWRNVWLSIATIFVIFLALMSVNFLIVVNLISDSAILAVKERIDVSVYFNPEVREARISEMKTRFEAMPEIKSVYYRSPEESFELFKERHKDNPRMQETIAELSANPMGSTLIITAKDLKDYPEILKAIDDPSYADLIEEKTYDDNQIVIDRINFIADNVKNVVLGISLIFVIIAILIVFNTVRIAIFTHQNEIAIMKLVGAGNWFIRFPFIFESIISGLLAVVAAMIFIYPILSLIQSYFSGFFDAGTFDLVSYFNANFLFIFCLQAVAIIIINFFSSLVAISKYLRV